MRSRPALLGALAVVLVLGGWAFVRFGGELSDPGSLGPAHPRAEPDPSPAGGEPRSDPDPDRGRRAAGTQQVSGSRRPDHGTLVDAPGPSSIGSIRSEPVPPLPGDVTCRVLDPRGEPVAGARLVRVAAWHDTNPGAIREAVTDGGGRATLAMLEPPEREEWAARGGQGPSVGLDATLAEDGLHDLVGVGADDLPLTFVLPPHGTLAVRLEGPGGGPWTAPTLLQLVPAGQEGGYQGSPRYRWVRAVEGRATFHQVQAGMAVVLQVDTLGDRRTFPLTMLAAGEARTQSLQLGSDRVSARLQLVGPDGRPLARTSIVVSDEPFDAYGYLPGRRSQNHRSDDEGRVTLVLEPVAQGQGVRTHHVAHLPAWGGSGYGEDPESETHPLLQGSFDLPAVPAGSALDLGRVVLERVVVHDDVGEQPDALLVRGRVEDVEGHSVPDASVAVTTRDGVRQRDPGDGGRELVASTGPGGEFEIRSRVQGSYELRVEHPEHGSAEVPFTPGQELRVVLARAGSLAGVVELASTFPAEAVELRLRASRGSAAVERRERRAKPGADGGFRFTGLAPGTYDLELRSRDWNVPLRTLSGLVVPAGGPCGDTRLELLVPDHLMRTVDLVLTSATGGPVSGGEVVVRPRGYAHQVPSTTFQGDRTTLVVPDLDLECEVRIGGHTPVVVPLRGAFLNVRVEPVERNGTDGPGSPPVPAESGVGTIGGG